MPDQPTVALPVLGARPPAPPRRRSAHTLTARAVLVTCAVALVSVLVTALVAVPLAVRGAERRDQAALAAQARLAADVLRVRAVRQRDTAGERLIRQLRQQDIEVYLIRAGQVDHPGLPRPVVNRVAAGGNVSGRRLVDGRRTLVEGRALAGGDGVVLARATTGPWRQVLLSLWLPLLAGLAAGAGAGLLLARRLARPIRVAATAAARLRAGDRAVRVPVEPPDEVADLAYALNGLAAALATSEGRQREFLLSVSHELRTPLTAIRGYAEALADGVIDPDGVPDTGRTMLAEAEHLDRLVSDLLALARLEAADFPLEPVPVDLARLAADAERTWSDRCAAVGVPFRVETPGGPVPAYTDPGRIRQVVDGLLENALRVVPPGAPVVLAVGPAGADPAAGGVVEVRDGGPGFTEDDLAVAFERGALHQRYRGVRKVGSGLGLALAAGLVRRLGGEIRAGHAPEGGAAFTVRLPADPYLIRTSA
ncbi:MULTISPECIES: sensor histidine kinase KdpD [Micromonospora]|uniref:histidine kinase n=1 Tax=Micromonospora solifontis TaxID=2487138 RepID=A0ABX9W8C5_9ACTN|nr:MULTISPECIES: HAMP domain-containing sensor histidine kinase [Micromonospora]NES17317.1 HAMP domain-containing histidine kinase [Micromonospora sp. PPF5-17B]NES39695.1 HAMP domain-containing histidine kinase [Micromonospora solifontis]NES59147.1 HAMP domain-containing histidine kinase [Micromonospora sp. PPF5-6]RNL87080.1 sensor histidine kinase [Micromonospora solifontis]